MQVAHLLTRQLMECGSGIGDFSWIDLVFFVRGDAPRNIGRSCGERRLDGEGGVALCVRVLIILSIELVHPGSS